MSVTRSTGQCLTAGAAVIAVTGGGYQGITRELDETVAEAAALPGQAYGQDVEIRFNSDRESGGAFLRTPDGRNADQADLPGGRRPRRRLLAGHEAREGAWSGKGHGHA